MAMRNRKKTLSETANTIWSENCEGMDKTKNHPVAEFSKLIFDVMHRENMGSVAKVRIILLMIL